MVFIKMLQTNTAINASRAMRNDFTYPKFLFKSNSTQPRLSNYTIPRVVQLETIVLYCRRNARYSVHTSPLRKFSECTARFWTALVSNMTGYSHSDHSIKLIHYGVSQRDVLSDKMVYWVVIHSFYFMLCQPSLLSTVISFVYKDKL